jgi:methionyl-tRNA synthetase
LTKVFKKTAFGRLVSTNHRFRVTVHPKSDKVAQELAKGGTNVPPEQFYLLDRLGLISSILRDAKSSVGHSYENRAFNRAILDIMSAADFINETIDHHKLWELAKDPLKKSAYIFFGSVILNSFLSLTLLLAPILQTTGSTRM